MKWKKKWPIDQKQYLPATTTTAKITYSIPSTTKAKDIEMNIWGNLRGKLN